MKIRVKIPAELINLRDPSFLQDWIDDILIWGMETEMDIAFYSYYYDPTDKYQTSKNRWAIFTVDNDYSYMFSLKYGATLHKSQREK